MFLIDIYVYHTKKKNTPIVEDEKKFLKLLFESTKTSLVLHRNINFFFKASFNKIEILRAD